jgi:trigger factor
VKLSVERLPASTVRLEIVADADEFQRAVERAFRRINQRVAIPGFRPGRAPRALLERRIGREVIVHEAHQELLDQLYRTALEREGLVPVSEPVVEIYQDEPLGFRVEVQVYPRVELNDYRSLRIEPREVEVTDEEVDRALDDLRKAQSVWVEPEQPRTPRDGDQVTIDLQAYQGEEPFQAPLVGVPFVLGESSLFPQIEEAIRNLRPGEAAEFTIEFTDDDQRVSPELRGKTLEYRLTLREVKEREMPQLDDEFARSVGDFQSLAELRERLRTDLLRQKALAARSDLLREAVERLTELASVEVPPALVERQVELQVDQFRQELRQRGSSLEEFLRLGEKSLAQLKTELRPSAEARLRQSLVLEAFAQAEGIDVSEQDLDVEIERLSVGGENPDQLRALYGSPYFRGVLQDELQNRRVTERLVELVTEGRGAVLGEAAPPLATGEQGQRVEAPQETLALVGSTDAASGEAGSGEERTAHGEVTEEPVPTPEHAH